MREKVPQAPIYPQPLAFGRRAWSLLARWRKDFLSFFQLESPLNESATSSAIHATRLLANANISQTNAAFVIFWPTSAERIASAEPELGTQLNDTHIDFPLRIYGIEFARETETYLLEQDWRASKIDRISPKSCKDASQPDV